MTHKEEIESVVEEFMWQTKGDQHNIAGQYVPAFTDKLEKRLRTTLHTHTLRILEGVVSKAKLVENPIEDNGELIDGSYYCIYKGDIDSMKKEVMNKTPRTGNNYTHTCFIKDIPDGMSLNKLLE